MVIMKTLELEIGGQPAQSLSEARFRNGLFTGTWSVPLWLDGIAAPVRLSLYLRPDADGLNGYARAHAETYSLPFAVVLTVTRGGTR